MTGYRAVTEMTPEHRVELTRLNNTRWWESGACVGSPVEWFLIPRDAARLSSKVREAQEANARALCAVCPVTEQCRREGELLRDTSTIRGGMTYRERTNARKAAS